MNKSLPISLLLASLTFSAFAQNWNQAAGPDGTWRYNHGNAPASWSVARNQNIKWKSTMPNGGQGGIVGWSDRLFLTTFPEYVEGQPKYSATILGHCLNAKTGKILWSVKLVGENASPMMYAYSDSTSWTPITDGKHVWFFNCSGEMGCWDMAGNEVWRRKFLAPGEPFNKQHEPILNGDQLISLEPLEPDNPRFRADRKNWHYLRGIDKSTGKTLWISEDATTYYCTSVVGKLPDGTRAILHGRGGPHDVPERPIGISLTSIEPGTEGKTLWRYSPDAEAGAPVDGTTFQALYTMSWTPEYSCWFRNAPEESHLLFDSKTGKLLKTQSLIKNVDFRQWNPVNKKYITHLNVNVREMKDYSSAVLLGKGEALHVFPQWHSNLVVDGYHYFLTSTGHRRNGYAPPGLSGPSHCIGRVHLKSGKVEYLELPVGVSRIANEADRFLYNDPIRTKTEDFKGRDVAAEDRSRTDGWTIPAFFGSPTAINGKLYITTMLGITYVINSRAKALDESALLSVNDLGPLGETWSLNSMSFHQGKLYHRSLKEVVCIGSKE